MKLRKNQITVQTTLLAASIFIGSNSFVLAAADNNSTPNQTERVTVPASGNSASVPSVPTTTNTNESSSTTTAAPAVSTDTGKPAAPADLNTNDTSSADTGSAPQSTNDVKKWKPGMELSIGTDTQDLVPTDDPELAKKQVDAYPDSPEAAFIYAVSLTRTSRVEEALQEVRRAHKLADQKGGAGYFDKMISTYEDLLKSYPKENRVRYGLAWAYYMKAYLLASYSRKVARWKAANPDPAKALADAQKLNTANGTTPQNGEQKPANKNMDAAKALLTQAGKSGKPIDLGMLLGQAAAMAQGNANALPKIPEFMDGVEAQDIPQIKKYFEMALKKMDELVAQKPDDVWAQVYRAHLKAEYTGNIDEAMSTWKSCSQKYPNNPAAYFFLGEGFLKKGDLKQSINNVSKAVALRGLGN